MLGGGDQRGNGNDIAKEREREREKAGLTHAPH